MATLRGLPGVRKREVEFLSVHSINGVFRALKLCRFVSAASDYGAVTVWIDDKGDLRAEFCRYRILYSEVQPETKASLKRWLKEWFPKMSERPD